MKTENYNETDKLVTEDAGLIAAAAISALPFIILGGCVIHDIVDYSRIRKTKKLYPKKHKDCITFEEFKKKSYKKDAFENKPDLDEEINGKFSELFRKVRGHRVDVYSYKDKIQFMVFYDHTVEYSANPYYDSNNGLGIALVSTHKRKIGVQIVDQSIEKHYKYYLLCAAIRYSVSDEKVSKFAKSFMKGWKASMESTIERLNEVKEFLESKDEKDDVDKKIEKAKETAENINKKETRGFISKKQAKEDLENLEDRIDDLKDKVGKNRKENDDKEDKDNKDE